MLISSKAAHPLSFSSMSSKLGQKWCTVLLCQECCHPEGFVSTSVSGQVKQWGVPCVRRGAWPTTHGSIRVGHLHLWRLQDFSLACYPSPSKRAAKMTLDNSGNVLANYLRDRGSLKELSEDQRPSSSLQHRKVAARWQKERQGKNVTT